MRKKKPGQMPKRRYRPSYMRRPRLRPRLRYDDDQYTESLNEAEEASLRELFSSLQMSEEDDDFFDFFSIPVFLAENCELTKPKGEHEND